MKIPVYTPGFEDSTLGNIYAARVIEGKVPNHNGVATGTAQQEPRENAKLGEECEAEPAKRLSSTTEFTGVADQRK